MLTWLCIPACFFAYFSSVDTYELTASGELNWVKVRWVLLNVDYNYLTMRVVWCQRYACRERRGTMRGVTRAEIVYNLQKGRRQDQIATRIRIHHSEGSWLLTTAADNIHQQTKIDLVAAINRLVGFVQDEAGPTLTASRH